jgi:hypothetical protein
MNQHLWLPAIQMKKALESMELSECRPFQKVVVFAHTCTQSYGAGSRKYPRAAICAECTASARAVGCTPDFGLGPVRFTIQRSIAQQLLDLELLLQLVAILLMSFITCDSTMAVLVCLNRW